MKVKGINPIELHVEKFVLGITVLVVAGFIAMQFLGSGASVEIEGRQYGPGEVDAVLSDRASTLQQRMNSTAISDDVVALSPDASSWVQRMMASGVAPTGQRLAMQPRPNLPAGAVLDAYTQEFIVPQLDAVDQPFVIGHADAIDPDYVRAHPELHQELFNTSEGPYDLSFNTVAARVDLQQLLEQFAVTDSSGDRLSIKPEWHDGRVFIFDVILERQELVNGNWSDAQIVPLIPEQISLRPTIEEGVTVRLKNEMLVYLRDDTNQASIIQPNAPPLVGGSWSFPTRPIAADDDNPGVRQLRSLQMQLNSTLSRISMIERDINTLRQRLEGPGGGGSGPGIGGGGGGGMGLDSPGGGAGGLDPGGSSGGRQTVDPTERLRRQLESAESSLSRNQNIAERLRQDIRRTAQEFNLPVPGEEDVARLPDLENDDSVLVWAHDIRVQPGRTYRYRMTVQVLNPFFGRAAQLVPEQQYLAESVTMNVQTTEWTTQTTVQPHTRFYVTSGDPASGRTVIEVLRLANGVWRSQVAAFSPGDMIGGLGERQDTGIDFRTGAYVLDILREGVGDGPAGASQVRVLVVMPDGSIVARSPARDSNDPIRMSLPRFQRDQ